jgi:ATP-dependent helicase/nuclease subunit B
VVPSWTQVTSGFALQMGLLGALAQRGVLDGVPSATVTALRYWKLNGGKDAGKASDPLTCRGKPPIETGAHIDATLGLFLRLCDDYLLGNAEFIAKLHPDHAAKYRDYDHLARVAEWLGKPEALP